MDCVIFVTVDACEVCNRGEVRFNSYSYALLNRVLIHLGLVLPTDNVKTMRDVASQAMRELTGDVRKYVFDGAKDLTEKGRADIYAQTLVNVNLLISLLSTYDTAEIEVVIN